MAVRLDGAVAGRAGRLSYGELLDDDTRTSAGLCPSPDGSGLATSLVVVAALRDLHCVVHDPVCEAVFLVDASRPESRPIAAELLRFADALVAVASDVLDQSVHSFEHLAISLPG